MTRRLIALYSPFPQSGKSTVAKVFHSFNPRIAEVKFAAAMREVVVPFAAEFVPGGVAEVEAWLEDERKDTQPLPGLGVTLRHMLQTLGTGWGRKLIHPDLWVLIARARIRRALDAGRNVVVDDLRYENEYDMLREEGAVIFRVTRADPPPTVYHESNARLEDRAFDGYLYNFGTMDEWAHEALRVALALELHKDNHAGTRATP